MAGVASRSSASPPLMRIPRRAALPMEAVTASGVASASAHGQVTTSRAMALSTAREGSTCHQIRSTVPARTSTTAVNHPERRSASSTIGARRRAPSSTCLTSLASRLSSPTRVTRTRSAEATLSVPPNTSSPGRVVTGSDSPVSRARLIDDVPDSTTPSAGRVSPALTSMRSPGTSPSAGASRISPSGPKTRAVVGVIENSSSAESVAAR